MQRAIKIQHRQEHRVHHHVLQAGNGLTVLYAEIGKRKGFENRSQGILYCVRQVLELEEYANGSVNFVMDFLKLLEEQPEIGKKYLAFLEEEKRRRE